ncbi:MAG: hypothetical protein U0169_08025 [Polyangiaceae bacterium]
MGAMRSGFGLVGAVVLAVAASAFSPAVANAEGGTTLKAWMKTNLGGPMAAADLAAVGKGLTAAGKLGPSDYPKWKSIADEGAAAAAKGNTDGVKASCKSCHDLYKADYKKKYKDRTVP